MNPHKNDAELDRMLLWFKAQLPPHDLEWNLTAHPLGDPWVIEGYNGGAGIMLGRGGIQVRGNGRCRRCGRAFEVTKFGNSIAFGEDDLPRVVEKMKMWVEREAEGDPCWGDVPDLLGDFGAIAVMDGEE